MKRIAPGVYEFNKEEIEEAKRRADDAASVASEPRFIVRQGELLVGPLTRFFAEGKEVIYEAKVE